ncbi:MAG TPA: SDR family oxidoreductase [Chloroflexota bacterium]|nr:SDR family oxidoreductase [Chloroflexota bacterium]
MDLGLQGKVTLVAGASKGLGKACALGFAREGVRVAMCSRGQEAIDAAAQDVARETGAEVLALAADVSRPEACERLVQQTVDRFGRLDILVNNAGGPPTGLAAGMSDEQWQTAFETNLMSAVRLTRAAVPHMRKAGAGRIINITSSGVRQVLPGLVLSNSIRAGVINFAKTLAVELGPDNILVNSVAPGRFATDRVVELDAINAKNWGVSVEESAKRQVSNIPLGRYGEPEELANVVVFLGSERASFVSGQTILIDGAATRAIF